MSQEYLEFIIMPILIIYFMLKELLVLNYPKLNVLIHLKFVFHISHIF